jgi:hypothetical protein
MTDQAPERYVEMQDDDPLMICVDCGAVVVDGEAHDKHHDQ